MPVAVDFASQGRLSADVEVRLAALSNLSRGPTASIRIKRKIKLSTIGEAEKASTGRVPPVEIECWYVVDVVVAVKPS